MFPRDCQHSMHIPKRIINLARDAALSSFSALAEQTVVDADNTAAKAMGLADSQQLRELNALRAFLRGEGRNLRTRMDRHFAGLLERAMQTMHVDNRRAAAKDIDYATLTLIDDDVVVRQIEIDRTVARLRDADPVALGRLNLTIAIIHDEHEVRERENPFRPYLLARSLYEGLRELLWDEAQSKLIYEALGQAMARRLPGFYGGLLEVFENGGITARLIARPAAMSHAQRERLAWQDAAQQLLGKGAGGDRLPPDAVQAAPARLLSKLERLGQLAPGGSASRRELELADVVWNMFHQPKAGRPLRQGQRAPGEGAGGPLDRVLKALQNALAAGMEPPAPLAIRHKLENVERNDEQARIIEMTALLFDSMISDEMLPASIQHQVARLFVPFLRAALIDPDLLHDARHPARSLLDRIGSVGVGVTPEMAPHAAIDKEIRSVVGAVLDLFDDEMGMFGEAQAALDLHVEALLVASDPDIARCAAAVAEAQLASRRLAGATSSLSARLQPLQIDPRVADFILGTWARVLSHPGKGAEASIAMLPELLWSAQEKTTLEDRGAMMRMLPELVRKVREGMASISLPEAPSKAAFDRLVAVHMDVLANKQIPARRPMSLEQFRAHFADFEIETSRVAGSAKDGWIGLFELEAAMVRRDAKVRINARSPMRLPQASDADFLLWARPGTGFEIRIDERYQQAVLSAVNEDQSAFLFTVARGETQVLYLRGPLLEAFEHAHVRPIEFAPLFDRGVASLMAGAEALSV